MIKGITVTLFEKTSTGVDAFNNETFSQEAVSVDNVLVGQTTTDDIVSTTDLNGLKCVFTIGIPKGDTHNWIDSDIEFDLAGHHRAHTFGGYVEGIESMVPTAWHRQIRCAEYE